MLRNNKGYSIKEMIILCAVLAIVFAIGIVKVSYAYQDADNTAEMEVVWNDTLLQAARVYVEAHPEEFTDTETYFYGSELVENNYFIDVDDVDVDNVRFKVTHAEGSEDYQVEIA